MLVFTLFPPTWSVAGNDPFVKLSEFSNAANSQADPRAVLTLDAGQLGLMASAFARRMSAYQLTWS
jgi:hypothetical protein